MPIISNNYVSPTWVNGGPPPIDASELQAITDTVQTYQILRGFGPPTTETAGIVGTRYVDLRTTPPAQYKLISTDPVKVWELDENYENAYVRIDASLQWEQGLVADNGGNTEATDRVRTPYNRYIAPRRCINTYLTIEVSNPNIQVKIQEYSGTPATSATATGRFSAYGGTRIYAVNPDYNYRLCARKVNGGDIAPEDIAENDVAVYWYVATDTSLTISNAAADAKAAGDALHELSGTIVVGMKKTYFYTSYSIVPGYFSENGVASPSPSGKYARTEYLWNGIGTRNAILLDSDTYISCIVCYDSSGQTDGTGHLRNLPYTKNQVTMIPDDAALIGLNFRRADNAVMTSADYDAIKDALYSYRPTDTMLEEPGVPADARVTGRMVSMLSYKNAASIPLVWEQGSISQTAGANIEDSTRVRTQGYVMLDSLRGLICYIPEGFELAIRRYKRDASISYVGYNGYAAGLVIIDNGENNGYNGYRFILRRYDDIGSVDPESVPEGLKIIPIYREWWEPGACGNSKPTIITRRCNQDVVADFLSVAETYYTHRNDKTDSLYDMTYGYNSCIQTTEYTREIDCSTFVQLVMRGWSYEQTQYYTKESGTRYPANPAKDWSVYPPDYSSIMNFFVESTGDPTTSASAIRTASQMGQWMIDQGWRVPIDKKLANVEPGDIVFWANVNSQHKPSDPNRFGCIGHVGICYSKRATTENDPWPADMYPYAHTIIEVRGGNPCCNKRYLEVGWDDAETGTITHSGVDYVALVCRPDLGALS